MKHPIESIQTIEESTSFNSFRIADYYLLFQSSWNQIVISIMLLINTATLIKYLSWHSGTSVLTSTLKNAFSDLIDTTFVVIIILSGLAAFAYGINGSLAGTRDFNGFLNSFNSMARLSFGLYEYDQFVSDGLGAGYDGLGLGNGSYFKFIMLWICFMHVN